MDIEIINQDNELLIDYRIVADGFGIEHKSLRRTLLKYFGDLKSRKLKDPETGWTKDILLLNERQIAKLTARTKPTPQTIGFHDVLVDAFYDYQEQHNSSQPQLPKDFREAIHELAKSLDKNAELETYIEENQSKIDYVNNVVAVSDSLTSVGALAKLLEDKSNNKIGQKTMFEWFRNNGYTFWDKENIPYQEFITRGYFVIKQTHWSNGNKSGDYNRIWITAKGCTYFEKKYFESIAPFQTELALSKYI